MTALSRRAFLRGAALATLSACAPGPLSAPQVDAGIPHDALAGWVRAVLQHFVDWLDGAQGFIGEVGWPGPEGSYTHAELLKWNKLGRMWLREATRHRLWVAYWASGPWPENYATVAHIGNPPTDVTRPGWALIEHRAPYPQANGVNLAGWEWDWTHQPTAASFRWLAERGITLVRVPFDWEMVQRHPGEPLHAKGAAQMLEVCEHAAQAGCELVLDCHNYEQVYYWSDTRSPRLMTEKEFVDLWVRLSELLQGQPGVAGYGLMNEPNPDAGSDPAGWERRSAACVEAIRARGDTTRIFVNTFGWSTPHDVDDYHPDGPWIDDPTGQLWYEAHHYFDPWEGGSYRSSYEDYRARVGGELAGIPAEPFVEIVT